MTLRSIIFTQTALIGAVFYCIHAMSPAFELGTTTHDHPYLLFTALLIGAGLIWTALIPILKAYIRTRSPAQKTPAWVWILLAASLGIRALNIGSTPIYEDDWNRYLWDGAVITQGINPYIYSPAEILDFKEMPLTSNITAADRKSLSDLKALKALSAHNESSLERVNNPDLTTLYPPAAQSVFALSAAVKPFSLEILRGVFLMTEALTLFLLIKALTIFGRAPEWALLYALNPLIIYAGFNAVHMDILIPPFLLAALILIRRHPFWAGAALSGAAAVKLWPLILAPLYYRGWQKSPKIYVSSALLIGGLSALCLWPLIQAMGENSGLAAYSTSWNRSSFLFPIIENMIGIAAENPGQSARIFVAAALTSLSLYFGFIHKTDIHSKMPQLIFVMTLALFFLSPAGFPWYAIWFLPFLAFLPSYGVALLTVTLPLYYLRFALGEQSRYDIYTDILTPLQFGLPLLICIIELIRHRHARPRH